MNVALHARREKGITRLARIGSRILLGLMIAASIVVAAVVVGPRFLPYQALVVRSGSMTPAIPTGSVALYRQEPATKVHVGQVILFAEPGDPMIHISHRVVEVVHAASGTYFLTKGDANPVRDNWRVPAQGTGWIVVAHVPYLGYALSVLSGRLARWLLLSVPAFALAILFLFELFRPDRTLAEPEAA